VGYHPEAKLWLVGTKNEVLTAYNEKGKVQWTFTSEMAPDTRKLGPYWHKSALPGVRSILVHNGKIFIGSAGTIEVLDAKGQLLARKYVLYGAMDTLFLHPETGKIMIIRPTGGAALMDIDPETYKVTAHSNWALGLTDNLNSYGFNQVCQYKVLFFKDANGQYRAADLLSGAQNRFIIRNAQGKALHEANFGPGMLGHNLLIPTKQNRTLRDMAMADLDGDGRMEFAVTHANGSIYILNEKAEVLKFYNLFTLPRSLAAGNDGFYVGLTDGRILKVDLSGFRTVVKIKGDVYLLKVLENGHLLAGPSTGDLTLF
jgi:outer membrane protein assembly factor BamB